MSYCVGDIDDGISDEEIALGEERCDDDDAADGVVEVCLLDMHGIDVKLRQGYCGCGGSYHSSAPQLSGTTRCRDFYDN